ncbi:non-specific lipid-transfer protein 1-like [Curcuma longa]|uniref:non-specific lipid-transfer protein 1-like n=1 Tax=Curcuma longa TaxID=136217 RepID=UPI003D9ED686
MAHSMPLVAALLLVSAAMLAVAPQTSAAVSCGNVVSDLAPCIAYAQGKTTTLSAPCCSGVRNLNNAAQTTADRRTACTCLKGTVGSIKGINLSLVGGIPGKCNVKVPYPISTSVDCSKVT